MRSKKHQQQIKCAFCDRSQSEVQLIIHKPNVTICDCCVAKFSTSADVGVIQDGSRECTFCSFLAHMPLLLRALMSMPNKASAVFGGPEHWICEECLSLCREILEEKGIT